MSPLAIPPAEEIEAARHAAGVFDYSSRGKLLVTGSDRIAFLQGMITSDVAALPVGAGQRSAIVTANGKMIANLLLVRMPGGVLLETGEGRAAVAAATLARYTVTEDVEVADLTDGRAILSLQGPRSEEALRAALPDLASTPRENYGAVETDSAAGPLVILRHHRYAAPGFDIWVATERSNALRATILAAGAPFELRECGALAREALRVATGRPAWGREITEDHFPEEVGLAAAVSVNKGCYVGQEVLSRIHHLGHVNRTLVRVELQSPPDAVLPLPLFAADREIGTLTSLAHLPGEPRPIGLAIVRRESASPRTDLETRTPTPIPVTIRDALA